MTIDLSKKEQAAKIVLEKRNLLTPPNAEVGLCIDISGSMQGLYKDNTVQNTVERVMALSMQFDVNKLLDVWTFDTSSTYIGEATLNNIENFVNKKILHGSGSQWGGTSYAPVLKAVANKYFPTGFSSMFKKATKEPVILFFITDGENDDEYDCTQVIESLASKNIYIQVIGIGSSSFRYVSKAADKYSNMGFAQITDIKKLSDEEVMEKLITQEFVDWVKNFK